MPVQAKDRRDIFYTLSKKNGYRARSIYKLKHINDTYKIFNKANINVMDLCAAPGSWSQYIAEQKEKYGMIKRIVAVDLQDMVPIEGVEIYKDDITSDEFIRKVKSNGTGPGDSEFDVIVCDGSPDVTGFYDIDFFAQIDLLLACLKTVRSLTHHKPENSSLNPETTANGREVTFVSKLFNGENTKYITDHFRRYFDQVFLTKPRSSTSTSNECFIICKGLKPEEEIANEPKEIDFRLDVPEEPLETCGYEGSGFKIIYKQ